MQPKKQRETRNPPITLPPPTTSHIVPTTITITIAMTSKQDEHHQPPVQMARYRSVLKEFMDFKLDVLHDPNEEFSREQLLTIRPTDIARWMCQKVYGIPDLSTAVAAVAAVGRDELHVRSSSLGYYKKALSYFIPDRHNTWDEETERGNPTRSKEVLDVIKAVKEKEGTVRRRSHKRQRQRQEGTIINSTPKSKAAERRTTEAEADDGNEEDESKNGADGTDGGEGITSTVTRKEHLALVEEVRNLRAENRQLRDRMERLEARILDHAGLTTGASNQGSNKNGKKINQAARKQPGAARAQSHGQKVVPPFRRQQTNAKNKTPPPADLSPHPRTLYLMWQEWEFGIGGRKAARLFTVEERGRVKYLYSRRKIVWDAISSQVASGHTADRAIERLYALYGKNTTPTGIVLKLRKDKQQYGGLLHPDLR